MPTKNIMAAKFLKYIEVKALSATGVWGVVPTLHNLVNNSALSSVRRRNKKSTSPPCFRKHAGRIDIAAVLHFLSCPLRSPKWRRASNMWLVAYTSTRQSPLARLPEWKLRVKMCAFHANHGCRSDRYCPSHKKKGKEKRNGLNCLSIAILHQLFTSKFVLFFLLVFLYLPRQ